MFSATLNNIILLILNCLSMLVIAAIIITVLGALYFKYFIEGTAGVCRCETRLEGKIVLVTGGNSGIGLETAKDLAKRGARVVIASRNLEKSPKAVKNIIDTTGNENVEYKHLDLSSFKSVRAFAQEFNRSYNRLDILVNNAGAVSTKLHDITEDGLDHVLQANYFGPFLLTNLLLKKLIKSKQARIVTVSSWFHHFTPTVKKLDDMRTRFFYMDYSYSKLCCVLWTKALAKRLPQGVTVNCLHPGAVATELSKDHPWIFSVMFTKLLSFFGKTAKEGAQTTIHAAVSDDMRNFTGKYLKDCKPYLCSNKAHNDELVETIWRDSLQITKSHLPETLLLF